MLDDQPGVEGQSPGIFTQLTLKQDLYIGGYEDSIDILVTTGVNSSFHGCIQRVSVTLVDCLLSSTIHACFSRETMTKLS